MGPEEIGIEDFGGCMIYEDQVYARGFNYSSQNDSLSERPRVTLDHKCGMRSVLDLSIIEEGVKLTCPECGERL